MDLLPLDGHCLELIKEIEENLPNPVTYALKSRTSPNAQPKQTVSTARDLGLRTEFSARATKKAREMLFYVNRSFATTIP